MKKDLIIGVLALQGSVREHVKMLKCCNVKIVEVRKVEELKNLDGLIIPGGESTVLGKLLNWYGLNKKIVQLIKKGLPVWGTCAGAILLAKKVQGKVIPSGLKIMDIEIERNAYGSQKDSFEEAVNCQLSTVNCKLSAIFIRAPRIKRVGKGVKILAKRTNGDPVMARQKNMLVTTFHPELSDDTSIHKYFVEMCEKS